MSTEEVEAKIAEVALLLTRAAALLEEITDLHNKGDILCDRAQPSAGMPSGYAGRRGSGTPTPTGWTRKRERRTPSPR